MRQFAQISRIYRVTRAIILSAMCSLILMGPVSAQSTFQSHRDQMLELASTLGSMHYLRGECNRREDQKWREYMLRMLDAEQPSQNFRSELITTFNESFGRQEQRFKKCNSAAKQEAKRLAERGRQLTQAMMTTVN